MAEHRECSTLASMTMPTNFIALLHIYIINDHMIYKSEFYKATFLWITLPFPCVNGISTIFITRGQFWPPGIVVACVCVCVYQSLLCPHDNSSPVQARITKFGPEKQNTLVKIPIVLGGNWPWPSRSNLTSNSKLPPFWACPNHYSPPILVRISKFRQ